MPKQIPIWQLVDAFEDDEFVPLQPDFEDDDFGEEDENEPDRCLSYQDSW